MDRALPRLVSTRARHRFGGRSAMSCSTIPILSPPRDPQAVDGGIRSWRVVGTLARILYLLARKLAGLGSTTMVASACPWACLSAGSQIS